MLNSVDMRKITRIEKSPCVWDQSIDDHKNYSLQSMEYGWQPVSDGVEAVRLENLLEVLGNDPKKQNLESR